MMQRYEKSHYSLIRCASDSIDFVRINLFSNKCKTYCIWDMQFKRILEYFTNTKKI